MVDTPVVKRTPRVSVCCYAMSPTIYRRYGMELKHLNTLILQALQNAGMADLNFDKDGNITGLNVTIELPSA